MVGGQGGGGGGEGGASTERELQAAPLILSPPAQVTRDICGFPAFFNRPLMRRINELYGDSGTDKGAGAGSKVEGETETLDTPGDATLTVSLRQFVAYWRDEIEPYDAADRFFRLVKQVRGRGGGATSPPTPPETHTQPPNSPPHPTSNPSHHAPIHPTHAPSDPTPPPHPTTPPPQHDPKTTRPNTTRSTRARSGVTTS